MRPFCRFLTISTGIIYWYYTYLLKIDEEEYGGHGALLQEGLFASFTLFLVKKTYHILLQKGRIKLDLVIDMPFPFCCLQLSWTLVYSLAHF